MASTHTIRHKAGGTVEVGNYTRSKAIKLMCTECMGWDGKLVSGCTATKCPLYPFRGVSKIAVLSLEARENRRKTGLERASKGLIPSKPF